MILWKYWWKTQSWPEAYLFRGSRIFSFLVGFAPKNLKINTHKIEIDCECGKPNTIENMIGCEGIKGKKNFAMYGSIGLVQEIKTWNVTPGIVSSINQNLRLEESK
jgi:hypothetical protein